ncbi:IclR family transcriptional regulator [Dactylosporangium cerinum]|uniref:IclR family transcriptional regulator n=1 Tax=Dactylosporangium cerinum TaxID=1434730 RepID=A0ABV9W4F1_9ACTN
MSDVGTGAGRRGRKPERGEPVLDRAFTLLGTFDGEHRVQTLTELAERSGIPRSTVLRLLRQLVANGAVEQMRDGGYVVGLRLLEIASLAPRGHGLRQIAMPYLEDLFHVTRQHVLLAVPDGEDALLVERLSARHAGEVLYRVGGRLPLVSTGVGQVFLAAMEPARRRAHLEAVDDGEPVGEWERLLADVRRNGFATTVLSEPWPRLSVAAPVLGRGGRVVAAVSVVVPDEDVSARQFVPVVRATALGISRELRSSTLFRGAE